MNITIKSIIGLAYLAAGWLIKHGYVTSSSLHAYAGYGVAAIAFLSHLVHNPNAEASRPLGNGGIQLGDTIKRVSLLLGICTACLFSGCAETSKHDLTKHPVRQNVVVTPNNDVVAPTNAMVTISTNKPRFSVRGFLFGYPATTLVYHTDEPVDQYSGHGNFLLADPAFAALDSHHTNQTVLGGNSAFSVGSATITVSTNGISAVGTAGSAIVNSIGTAAGNVIGQAAHSTVTGTP